MSKSLITEINELHSEFKAALARNDSAAETRLNEAMDRVEAKMKALEAAANRPQTGEEKGATEVKALRDLALGKINETEYKALSGSVQTEGGYTVPKVIADQILNSIVDISPMRSVARVVSVPTTDYNLPFSPTGAASGWVGDKDSRPATNTPTFVNIKPTFGELYANPQVTQQILDDSQFDLAGWLATSVNTEFARAEGAAFVNGDGNNKPTGFLQSTTAATGDATRAFGTLQYFASGAASAMPTSADVFIDMVQSMKTSYLEGAVWMCSRATIGALRKYKDTTNQYLWQPSLVAGTPATFNGYPIVNAEDMGAVAAGALPLAFGNFNAGYLIADRIGVSTLVDRYSNKPYVGFYTTKRTGGCVVDSSAIKLLKIAAS